MKQHQTSKDSFARSLIGLSIGIVVLLGGVILLFQNFYISADLNTSVTRNTTVAEPTQPATTSSETDSSNKPQTVTSNSIVPPVLLSLEDKQVISANDSITMPAPAKPRATMASEVEPATINTPIDTSPANAITPPASPPEKTLATNDETPSSKTAVQNANKATPKASDPTEEKSKKDKVALTSTQTETGKTGWIYAGQFSDGKWQAKGLIIGDELPSMGHSYALNWGANIRANPPGKTKVEGLSENVGYLAQGRKVEVVQLKQSGNKGHIWVQIKR